MACTCNRFLALAFASFWVICFGLSAASAQEIDDEPSFDWDLISLEQNSQRLNGSVLSGFHNIRSPGVTPHRAFKAGMGMIYSQEDQIAALGGGAESSFSTQRLIANPKLNYGLFEALEAGAGLEATWISGKEVRTLPSGGSSEESEENLDLSAAVVGVKWALPRWFRRLRLGLAFDSRIAVNRAEFGMLESTLFNVETDWEWLFTSRFSLVGNLQLMTSDDFADVAEEVVCDLGATYTFSDQFRGLLFGTLKEDDPARTVVVFLGFAGQYLKGQHSVSLAVDFQLNDASREVRTEGLIDLEVSYTFTFR